MSKHQLRDWSGQGLGKEPLTCLGPSRRRRWRRVKGELERQPTCNSMLLLPDLISVLGGRMPPKPPPCDWFWALTDWGKRCERVAVLNLFPLLSLSSSEFSKPYKYTEVFFFGGNGVRYRLTNGAHFLGRLKFCVGRKEEGMLRDSQLIPFRWKCWRKKNRDRTRS